MSDSPTLAELGAVLESDPGPETIAESIRSAMSETEAGGSVPSGGGAADAVPAEPAEPPGGQPRAPDGKFVAAPAEPITPADPAAPAATPEYLEPPTAWALEHQEAFRALDPIAQKFVMDKVTELAPNPEYTEMEQNIFASRRPVWERMGISPAAAMGQLVKLSDFAESRPADFVQWFMNQRGITPEMIGFGTAPTPAPIPGTEPIDPAESDPVVQSLRSELATVKAVLDEVQGTITNQAQLQEQSLNTEVNNEINNFQNAKDANGALLHPYFNDVRPIMASLYSSGQAPNLERAYEMACRAHSEVSGKLAASEKAAADRAYQKAEQEKAANARKAGATVAGSPSAVTPQSPTGDLRADLKTEFAKHGLYETSPAV